MMEEKKLNNGPKVLFEDFALFLKMGQCLNILDPKQIQEYTKILASLLEKGNWLPVAIPSEVSHDLVNEVANSFSKLLNKAGIEKHETCILTDISKNNEDYFEFKCLLCDANKSLDICIGFNTLYEPSTYPSSITIRYPNLIQRFECIQQTNDNDANLRLASRQIFEYELYHYCRYFSPYAVQITLFTNSYNIDLLIEPKKEYIKSNQNAYLPCESKLEEYLNNLGHSSNMSSATVIDLINMIDSEYYQKMKITTSRKNSESCFELERHISRHKEPGLLLEMTADEIRLTLTPDFNWKEHNNRIFDFLGKPKSEELAKQNIILPQETTQG